MKVVKLYISYKGHLVHTASQSESHRFEEVIWKVTAVDQQIGKHSRSQRSTACGVDLNSKCALVAVMDFAWKHSDGNRGNLIEIKSQQIECMHSMDTTQTIEIHQHRKVFRPDTKSKAMDPSMWWHAMRSVLRSLKQYKRQREREQRLHCISHSLVMHWPLTVNSALLIKDENCQLQAISIWISHSDAVSTFRYVMSVWPSK